MKAWLFDIDGVITSPTEKKIIEPEILFEIIKRLESGEPVALVSGRALAWIERNVFELIKLQAKTDKVLNNLFLSAEFGGISATIKNGELIKNIDNNKTVPEIIISKATKIVTEKYSNIVFIDKEKETQFTVEIKKGILLENFRTKQKELSKKLSEIIIAYDPSEEIEVHDDRVATNIKHRGQNKYFASRIVLEWLNSKNSKPELFVIFGDSLTDLEMGREIQESGKNVKFIFVGDEMVEKENFEITIQGNFDKGTLEYLKNN